MIKKENLIKYDKEVLADKIVSLLAENAELKETIKWKDRRIDNDVEVGKKNLEIYNKHCDEILYLKKTIAEIIDFVDDNAKTSDDLYRAYARSGHKEEETYWSIVSANDKGTCDIVKDIAGYKMLDD